MYVEEVVVEVMKVNKVAQLFQTMPINAPQSPCQTQNGSRMPNIGIVWEFGAHSQLSALEGVEGRAEAPGLDQEEGQAIQLVDLASKTNHKLVITHFAPFWVLGQATGDLDSFDSPRPGLGGSHHLPPYNVLCSSARRLHPNGSFSRDSQSGVPKLSWFGLPRLWVFITSRPKLGSRRGLNQSCSFR